MVAGAAEQRRDHGAAGADEREECNAALAKAEGRLCETQGHRRPEQAERRHHQRRRQRAPPQHRLVAQQTEQRGNQRAIGGFRLRAALRQGEGEHAGEQDERGGAEAVEGAPAPGVGDQAGQRPRQQDADHQAAHDIADDAAGLAGRRHRGGDRHQDLDRRTGGAEDEQHDQQRSGGGREGGDAGRKGGRQEHAQDQGAVLGKVRHRHQEEQAGRIAEQSGHRDEADAGCAGAERRTDQADQRLRREQIGDDDAGGGGEEQRLRAGDGAGGQPLAQLAIIGIRHGVLRKLHIMGGLYAEALSCYNSINLIMIMRDVHEHP